LSGDITLSILHIHVTIFRCHLDSGEILNRRIAQFKPRVSLPSRDRDPCFFRRFEQYHTNKPKSRLCADS